MSRKDSKTVKRIAVGGAIMGVAGYLAGLLTAPKSGKETRRDIKDKADKGLSEAEKNLKKLHTELNTTITAAKEKSDTASGKAKGELDQLVDKAKETKEKVRNVLSAVHEGDADDKDLAKAIKDANAALDHLKSYLKK